ncbi:hypothetical protein C7974DRAFT_420311 [Boeremia exigua]|uniref:uncharacterized protein n=1 Tax=Boeremia exigua TaxID=749465 RepID=UPI001E8E56E2|nr:uncharacterized protein C7974DRAFT_420311 [Boeremia exigua]KAH6644899.1 hypothetical protein C7974DRAFT_420311 [Boeremia exigua]
MSLPFDSNSIYTITLAAPATHIDPVVLDTPGHINEPSLRAICGIDHLSQATDRMVTLTLNELLGLVWFG